MNVLGASHAIAVCECSIHLHKEACENIQVKSEVTEGCHLIILHGRCSLVMCLSPVAESKRASTILFDDYYNSFNIC